MVMGMMRANSKDNSKRRYRSGGPRPDNNEYKRSEATERQAKWARLTPQQQVKALDYRLGKDVGAVKQRARIWALIRASINRSTASSKHVEKKTIPDSKERAKDRRERERTERLTR